MSKDQRPILVADEDRELPKKKIREKIEAKLDSFEEEARKKLYSSPKTGNSHL